jgi:Collagen triple helix repeat (20 copies)
MKKFLSILIVISLVQVGISYAADPATDLEDRDYIFGTSKNSDVNLNQVLFLLAGKDGTPGVDGIAGRDGIDGINGINGIDGKDGKDGKDGTPGSPGSPGAPGAPGKDGKDGTDGVTGDLTYGAAAVTAAGCTRTATVALKAQFNGEDFVFNQVSFSDVDEACGTGTKVLALYVKIIATSADLHNKTGTKYIANDVLKCTYTIPLANTWSTGRKILIENNNFTCENTTNANRGAFTLNNIYTADFTNRIGFEIYER